MGCGNAGRRLFDFFKNRFWNKKEQKTFAMIYYFSSNGSCNSFAHASSLRLKYVTRNILKPDYVFSYNILYRYTTTLYIYTPNAVCNRSKRSFWCRRFDYFSYYSLCCRARCDIFFFLLFSSSSSSSSSVLAFLAFVWILPYLIYSYPIYDISIYLFSLRFPCCRLLFYFTAWFLTQAIWTATYIAHLCL